MLEVIDLSQQILLGMPVFSSVPEVKVHPSNA